MVSVALLEYNLLVKGWLLRCFYGADRQRAGPTPITQIPGLLTSLPCLHRYPHPRQQRLFLNSPDLSVRGRSPLGIFPPSLSTVRAAVQAEAWAPALPCTGCP